MPRINSLEIINSFFNNSEKKLLFINDLGIQINSFYLFLLEHMSKKNKLELNLQKDLKNFSNTSDDLFGIPKIYLFLNCNIKDIEVFSNYQKKGIFIVDYKIFKKFSSQDNCINSYNFKLDLQKLLQELSIDNQVIYNNILHSPESIYSETSKFLINKNAYEAIGSYINDQDNIASLRKDYFNNKKNNNLVELFKILKKEVSLKKFSFLTF